MPTENRRVAAYLPKNIDKQLEIFKTERGLKGDSPAIIAILEAFFGVSQEVAYLSDSETTNFTSRIEAVEQRLSQIKDELLSELRGELKSYLKSELVSEPLELELKNEPNSKLQDEVSQPIQQLEIVESSQESTSLLEDSDEKESVEANALRDELASELPLNLLSEPLIKPITGTLLARRLNYHRDNLSKVKSKLSEEEFYQWTITKDPDGIAWKFLKGGRKYLPANELPDELLGKLLSWIKQNDVTASHSEAMPTA